ncbi:MAG: DUF1861 family protein [Patescibacteria group bacterium]|nr:DUF1861 family protein [Patescibacteria group bacterium]
MNIENIHIRKENLIKGIILEFEHRPDESVYNPSRPFEINGRKYILARVENTQKDESRVYPFVLENGIWRRVEWLLSNIELEDPAITIIDGKILFTAVRVLEKPKRNKWIIRTEFYYGDDIFSLKKIAEGPIGMKDIRLVEFKDREGNKKIGVFTRPYIGKKRRGRIGYLEISSLSELGKIDWRKSQIIELPILELEWVGTNDVYYLNNGLLCVLAHIGSRDKNGYLHYYAVTFIFDPKELRATNFKIVAVRDNFPDGKYKSQKTKDVIFPGGFEGEVDPNIDKIKLYCGLSDAQVGLIEIESPFKGIFLLY